ncbi:GNAT family N-acetyltransferase [Photobacterium sp. GJ3]|uniref:GNAT family N-acetyltransferase n=1 Tax=Photobacterium sp. GJ3 TaxID=2829502 RepID=UPI001B8D0758|nr:GNAT family N-acetyltransferase [Photobacterium sp. GJ3]QUJ68669.1 GNAT family N-acetyltransferase [Photobacterium sp. GJ3]
MELITLAPEHESSFLHFYQDFEKFDPENAGYYAQGTENFAEYVKQLSDEAQGINLREDYVPCTHLWLIDDGVLLGAIRIRHHIENEFLSLEGGHIGYDIAPSARNQGHGKRMLTLALPVAKALGIEKALVTADEDNLASRSVIEKNGGKFEKVIRGKVFPEPIARYWIECTD